MKISVCHFVSDKFWKVEMGKENFCNSYKKNDVRKKNIWALIYVEMKGMCLKAQYISYKYCIFVECNRINNITDTENNSSKLREFRKYTSIKIQISTANYSFIHRCKLSNFLFTLNIYNTHTCNTQTQNSHMNLQL